MKEVFYEETATLINEKPARVKFNIFKTLSILCYVISGLWFIIVFFGANLFQGNVLLNIVSVLVPFILTIVMGIMLGIFKNRFYLEYDYTLVSGSVRISKVIKNYKRKNLFIFDTEKIEQIGKYGSETFEKYLKSPGVKQLILTSNQIAAEGKEFFYMVVNLPEGKKLLVLECTELFMANVMQFCNRYILEKDYNKQDRK